uniref:Rho-GAP domain-containing protein n=1 Tax=Megaselia scalaris TaxID=36166 RepID=T1H4W4_MEGSC
MTDKNLAIVWAPNLLRSPALESGGVAALQGVGVQAVVTEYLIKNCRLIFDSVDDIMRNSFANAEHRMDSLTDCESLLIEQREHDQSLTFSERPKSLSAAGPKLISLEEAQERHSRLDSFDLNKAIPIPPSNPNIGSYIEVGGGPSSLPDKYHTKDARKADREKKVFSVRQLATKFEISPSAEQKPQNQKIKQLDRSAQITRSLDENAFVREFGSVKKIDDFTKSVQTISRPIDDDRKAKTLNLPKKIPGQVNLQKVEESASLDVKITPTNENPISLIQNNAISGVQLNRDRIERIKE